MSARHLFRSYDPTERDEAVLNAWAEGKPFSQIAAIVPGVMTRSTVSGIIHRGRERGDPRAERRAPPKANGPKPKKPKPQREDKAEVGAARRAHREATRYQVFTENRTLRHDADEAERRARSASERFKFVRYVPPRIKDDGLESARIWNPATDPRPDFLRWSR